MTILKLLRCWRSCVEVTSAEASEGVSVSQATSLQLLLVIKQGIRTAECQVLDQLEKCVYEKRGPGKENVVALWATLWSLMFTYRDCAVVSSHFSSHQPTSLREDLGNLPSQKSKQSH